MAVVKRLAKDFKNLKKLVNILNIELIDEELDNWKITFIYPDSKVVILKFKFHLLEWLPPKATVVFPTNISWVCFEELGTKKWTKDTNLYNLLLCLHNEYKTRCAKEPQKKENQIDKTQYFDDETADKKWKYVKSAHKNWEMADIDELTKKLDPNQLNAAKIMAKEELTSN